MKPHRIRMTHNLLLNYGLYRKMEIYVSSIEMGGLFAFNNFDRKMVAQKMRAFLLDRTAWR